MEKKQLTLVVVSLLVVVLSVSVAYFTAQIIGTGKEVSVTSANLQIIFKDEDGQIAGTDIEPGWTSTKTFTVKNSTKSEYKYNIVLKDLVNTFVTEGYLQYKITSTNSGYNMTEFKDVPKSSTATDAILAYSVSVPVGTTQTYTIEFKYSNDENIDQSKDMGKKLSGTLFITEGTIQTLSSKLLEDKTNVTTRTDFSTVLTADNTKTLYTSTENGTTVYYFAGNATDNWVKFGKINSYICTYEGKQVFIGIYNWGSERISEVDTITSEDKCSSTNICVTSEFGPVIGVTQSQCSDTSGTWLSASPVKGGIKQNDLYWRIIRTNADGGIRLLYHGTSHDSTNAYIGTLTNFNSTYNDSMYVGYMYGTSGTLASNRTNTNNSTIKTAIDAWYENNLKISYGKYLSTTAIYCNDREVGSGTYSATSGNFNYKARPRLETNKTPIYDCTNISDAFSVSNTSAKLDYPIGLMTADEVSFAGGVVDTKAPAYFYRNSSDTSTSSTGENAWWTMSPYSGPSSILFYVSQLYGLLYFTNDNFKLAVRPVTSLKSCVKWASGDGSADNPYTIDLDPDISC